MKKLIMILCISLLLVSANIYAESNYPNSEEIHQLIIFKDGTSNYLDTYQNYNQSLIANLNVDSIALSKLDTINIQAYDSIYLDSTIIGEEIFNNNKSNIIEYVRHGGHLFLEDKFHSEFPLEFLGASEIVEIEKFPKHLSFPSIRENLKGIQEVVQLFHKDITTYFDDRGLDNLNKGQGFRASTATPIVKHGELTLYGLNKYGEGTVFFANSLLPNYNYITGFDMKGKADDQQAFSYTFASGNYLLRNEFASYISKAKYGYSIKKVLGTNGRPAMVWQNHFEVGSALRDESMEKWIDILKEYNQIPSYSLARSLFEWGQWTESIIYHRNIGSTESPKFQGEEANSHYSSGEHLMTDTDYVRLNDYPEKKDLASKIDLPYRAYPTIGDLNGDGTRDIISGSSDGYIYYFQGKTSTQYEEKVKLLDNQGNPIKVNSYSAPVLVDVNKDNKLDLIIGSGEGTVELYINNGDNSFKKHSTIIEDKNLKNLTPTVADINGNGTMDLIVGESKGTVSVHIGTWKDNFLSFNKTGVILKEANKNANLGSFPAPSVADINKDGKLELIVGDATGYIKEYTINYPNIEFKGYLQGTTLNPKGDKRLWGGYYSVPILRDLNKDGLVDLIIGQIEFGLPIPIDSAIFPYKEDLEKALEYAKENHLEIYPHVYFHPYKNTEQENKELELHKKAFESYNLGWNKAGVNQHTWNINNINPSQTFINEEKSGLRWNSGFRPSLKAGEPTLSRDYLWAVPFKLSEGENTRDFTLFNPSPNIPILDKAYGSISHFDLPISYFYHMEYGVNTEKGLEGLREKAAALEKIRNESDYNFMMEDQMFQAIEANMEAKINIRKNIAYDRYEFIINTKTQDLKQNPYREVVGIKFELGESLLKSNIKTDAHIYNRDGKDLYIGLEDTTRVYISSAPEESHITRVNGPITIVAKKEVEIEEDIEILDELQKIEVEDQDIIEIKFNYKGLQQIKFYAPQGIEIYNQEFEIETQGDHIILTRYGGETTLKFKYN